MNASASNPKIGFTPIRMRSPTAVTGRTNYMSDITRNFTGLRWMNDDRVHLVCPHLGQQPLPSKEPDDYSWILRQLNGELQRFVDDELMGNLKKLSDNMENKQYAFEKKILKLVS